MTSIVKIWLYLVCASVVFGFINALALAFAPLVAIGTISLTLAYFWVITRVDGPLWEFVSVEAVE